MQLRGGGLERVDFRGAESVAGALVPVDLARDGVEVEAERFDLLGPVGPRRALLAQHGAASAAGRVRRGAEAAAGHAGGADRLRAAGRAAAPCVVGPGAERYGIDRPVPEAARGRARLGGGRAILRVVAPGGEAILLGPLDVAARPRRR